MSDAHSIPVDRELTLEERKLIEWMLLNGKPEARDFLPHLEKLRVIGKCSCGCASIDFAIDGKTSQSAALNVIADFVYGDNDTKCGVFLFTKEGLLAGLEVFGLAIDTPKNLPKPEELSHFPSNDLT